MIRVELSVAKIWCQVVVVVVVVVLLYVSLPIGSFENVVVLAESCRICDGCDGCDGCAC
jgi:hypothetical protein